MSSETTSQFDEWASALEDVLAFNSRDWAEDRADAWIYGLVLGWDSDEPDESAMSAVAARHGWSDATVERLRRCHDQFLAAAVSSGVQQ